MKVMREVDKDWSVIFSFSAKFVWSWLIAGNGTQGSVEDERIVERGRYQRCGRGRNEKAFVVIPLSSIL